MAAAFELLIKNARLARPGRDSDTPMDVAVRAGRIAALGVKLGVDAAEVHDAGGKLLFPGVVDSHMHVGIYAPLAEDARSESRAAATGGVTSMLTYFRTGRYYLNRNGSYRSFYPEVLSRSAGNYWVDYGYHIAPIERGHIDEMEWLLEQGVPSFKIFMFYGGYGLHGKTDGAAQREFLMIGDDEDYDIAHFEFVMRSAAKLAREYPELAEHISVSLHCELAEILNAYTRIARADPSLTGLRAYSAARPPHSEGLAVWIAAYLAGETECLNVNLLHLSSRKAMEAAFTMQETFPRIRFSREVTIGHLLLDYDTDAGCRAKVNPPIRSREDVEFLWQAVLDRKVDWVVSDHACCAAEQKTGGRAADDPDNIWVSKSGFGGTEYLLSGLFSEGSRRGMPPSQIAELLCSNPARRYGLHRKGDIAVGFDADLVLLDPEASFRVRAEASESAQGYTPFEGQTLTGKVVSTWLRGQLVYRDGEVLGPPRGEYLRRPSPPPD